MKLLYTFPELCKEADKPQVYVLLIILGAMAYMSYFMMAEYQKEKKERRNGKWN